MLILAIIGVTHACQLSLSVTFGYKLIISLTNQILGASFFFLLHETLKGGEATGFFFSQAPY